MPLLVHTLRRAVLPGRSTGAHGGLPGRQVWDKDFNKADDPIARATVTLGEGLEGTMSLPVPGVEGNDDVQQVSCSTANYPLATCHLLLATCYLLMLLATYC